eukprot:4689899-Lingulodinium_polyedra.AAC.1
MSACSCSLAIAYAHSPWTAPLLRVRGPGATLIRAATQGRQPRRTQRAQHADIAGRETIWHTQGRSA